MYKTKIGLPEGKFRYYFIDIGEIPTGQRGELFATYSGLALLVEKLQNDVEKLTEDSKIFVCFPNVSRPDYKKVYASWFVPGSVKIDTFWNNHRKCLLNNYLSCILALCTVFVYNSNRRGRNAP